MKSAKKKLPADQQASLLKVLEARFLKNRSRHKGIEWTAVLARLEAAPQKVWSLDEMERTGGEPDVVAFDKKSGEYTFYDCSPETPKERRSICFDREALDSRKEHKPANTAMDMAAEMGIEILSETEYYELQKIGEFDLKTSTWIRTPPEVRKLGGALFCDRRFGRVFTYHNGASSYYGVRGFRGSLKV
ncbi:MAG: DUF4256 domain-containing protein [Chitinophagaceae bacterium]|nr:MAG: DUF4256 domain-containing protein [Chitinophagaceae bacterium]